jgi:surfeit locus 1 family protein
MISLTAFKKGFTLSWRIGLLVLIVIGVLLRLGFWQLQRADEKKQMMLSYQHHLVEAPVLFNSNSKKPVQYQTIRIKGQWLPHVLLLDNQHYQHRFGYHVISPLLLADGQVILIDRGWLLGDATRRVLPIIESSPKPITLLGSVYYPSINPWQTGSLIEKKQGNLVVIEFMNLKLISQFLQKPVYPFIIRLDQHEEGGYVRDWSIVSMPPERHYAYAFQWFGIALIVFIIFIVLSIKKKP